MSARFLQIVFVICFLPGLAATASAVEADAEPHP
jgi:hypothetical protein